MRAGNVKMKLIGICTFLLVGVFSGCMIFGSRSYGTYSLNKYEIEGKGNTIIIRGGFSVSPFIEWKDTPYGYPPISLVRKIVTLELESRNVVIRNIENIKTDWNPQNNSVTFSSIIVIENPEQLPKAFEARGDFPINDPTFVGP